jgi:hypothetical protein
MNLYQLLAQNRISPRLASPRRHPFLHQQPASAHPAPNPIR